MSDSSEEIEDATVVVNNNDHTVVVNDATVVVNGEPGQAPSRGRYAQTESEVSGGSLNLADRQVATESRVSTQSGTAGNAVDEPETGVIAVLPTRADAAGLDPSRPISAAPGMMPWQPLPSGERGLTQGIPVSYGARPQAEVLVQTGIDEVHRKVGPAPLAAPVVVREGREALPSLERRERRRRMVTLAVYGAVIVVCAIGLWQVASIAFGW